MTSGHTVHKCDQVLKPCRTSGGPNGSQGDPKRFRKTFVEEYHDVLEAIKTKFMNYLCNCCKNKSNRAKTIDAFSLDLIIDH